MTSLRDTSADAAAELQRTMSARRAAEVLAAEAAARPVTLTGRQVEKLLAVLRRTFERLQRLEADKRRPYREREGIRADRILISAALAHIEAASVAAEIETPEPGSGVSHAAQSPAVGESSPAPVTAEGTP